MAARGSRAERSARHKHKFRRSGRVRRPGRRRRGSRSSSRPGAGTALTALARLGTMIGLDGRRLEKGLDKTEAVPSLLVVFPVVAGVARGLPWTPTRVAVAQLVVLCIAMGALWLSQAMSERVARDVEGSKGERRVWVDAAKFSGRSATTESKGRFCRVSLAELSRARVWDMQKSVLVSLAIALALPLLLKLNQPILIQSVSIPLNLLRDKLFQSVILGAQLENVWGEVSEEEVERRKDEPLPVPLVQRLQEGSKAKRD